MSEWASRVVDRADVDPAELVRNPENFRVHPDRQRREMGRVLDRVGWIERVIVNRTTGRLVDGHMRVEEAIARGEATVPVSFVELSEEDERLVLLSLDAISGLAITDDAALVGLLDDVGDGLGGLVGWMRPDARPAPNPTQDQIDRRAEELASKFVREGDGSGMEVVCPECGCSFGLAGTGVTS